VDPPEFSETMMNMDNMHSPMGDTIHDQVSSPPTPPQSHQKLSASVLDFQPNLYGIRGMDENVSEWGIRFQKTSLREREEPQYVILGGLRTGLTKKIK